MQTINKNQFPVFDNMKYVLKARSKDTIKPLFNMVYINKEEKTIVCTDSRRLHLWNFQENESYFENYESGMYDVIKSDTKEICLKLNAEYSCSNFPDYKQIMPAENLLVKVIKTSFNNKSFNTIGRFYRAFYKMFTAEESGIVLNSKFFDDAFNNGSEFSIQVLKEQAENGPYMCPIVFNMDNTLKALVMPIQC